MKVDNMTNEALIATYKFCADRNSESETFEDVKKELNRRVRNEIVKQLEERENDGQSEACSAAVLRGFEESATWHFDAARTGDFAKSIAGAVSDYLSDECDVFAQQHSA
jgi:hypothetical protein